MLPKGSFVAGVMLATDPPPLLLPLLVAAGVVVALALALALVPDDDGLGI